MTWDGLIWRNVFLIPGETDRKPDWRYGRFSIGGSEVWWNHGHRGFILRPQGLQISVSRTHAYIARTDGTYLKKIVSVHSQRWRLHYMARFGRLPE